MLSSQPGWEGLQMNCQNSVSETLRDKGGGLGSTLRDKAILQIWNVLKPRPPTPLKKKKKKVITYAKTAATPAYRLIAYKSVLLCSYQLQSETPNQNPIPSQLPISHTPKSQSHLLNFFI